MPDGRVLDLVLWYRVHVLETLWRCEWKKLQRRPGLADLRRMEVVLNNLIRACQKRRSTDACPILAALEVGGES